MDLAAYVAPKQNVLKSIFSDVSVTSYKTAENGITTLTMPVKDNTVSSPNYYETVATSAKNATVEIDTNKIQGKLKNIYYYNKNEVLVLGDKLYLYDLQTGNILYETKKPELELEMYYPIDNGFAVIGRVYENSGGSGFISESGRIETTCTFYDSKLNETGKISLTSLLGENEHVISHAISKDGTQLAIGTSNGLYLYDIEKNKKATLVNLFDNNAANRFGLTIFDEVAFIRDDKVISFKSQSHDVPATIGKSSFDTCGSIGIDGSGLSIIKTGDYTVKEMTAYNSFVLYAEDFTVPSGRLMIQDIASGKSKIVKTKTKKESGTVFGSDNGAYFATSVIDKNTITVRVYDTKDGSLIVEKATKIESHYTWRTPKICVIDDLRTVIVLLGSRQDDIDTQCLIFSF